MKTLLIVDTDPAMRNTLTRLIKGMAGVFQTLDAENAEAALDVIGRVRIDLVIAGLRIAEADSLKLVGHLRKHHPDIRVVIMTEVSSDTLKAQIETLSVDSVIEEPVDLEKLAEMLFRELDVDYGGRIRGISLSSFLQMIELEGKTCHLKIQKDHEIGSFFFDEGDLIAAETGGFDGKAAALAILKWDNILIDIDYTSHTKSKQISLPLMSLLLESRRIEDENGAAPADKRQHERIDCEMDVDYDIGDWSYGGRIRDISLGGVYIETKQPASKGQEILLTLTTPDLARHCTITGKIARRDPGGIGVQFNELSLHQLRVVKSYLVMGK